MSKKNYLWPLLVAVSLAIGVVVGGYFGGKGVSFSVKENIGRVKLNKLIDLIEHEYVDNVNTDSIIDRTVNNILSQLDPHSTYISRSEFEDVQNAMKGSFVGIGINYYVLNDTLAVVKPLRGGPSAEAGIKAGDRILYADKVRLFDQGLPNDSIVNLLRGVDGSKVFLKVYRKSTEKIFDVQITRGEVPLKSVDAAIKIDDQRGYIKINRFSETTYDEFKTGLEALLNEGISELILDLRENGGGYMEPAIQIADDFLRKDDIIVKTVNKKGNVRITKASNKGLFVDQPLYVLINENSASASEIIAGAVQDNDRGSIVGRRSYGKGLVQREMYLGDGSAVRLTTARYYTPSGRSIQKPYMDGLEEYNNDLNNRFKSGELYSKDSIHLADSLKFKTVGGRIVFGGGGIVPDVFVPLKTKHGEDAIQLLMKTSLVSYYVFEEIEKERAVLEQLSPEELATYIYENPNYFDALKAHLKVSGLTFNLDRHKKNIMFYLVGEYIHQLYDEDAYYHWILQEDPMIQKINTLK
ncbi:MAG TPA: S41 family peptidase [Flavobacterium sp.]|nr:S41 family peptidase [Flavobacterium sp.]